jgi:hypothetical protein
LSNPPKAIGAIRHDILVAYYHIVRDQVPSASSAPTGNTGATRSSTAPAVYNASSKRSATRSTSNKSSKHSKPPDQPGHRTRLPSSARRSDRPYPNAVIDRGDSQVSLACTRQRRFGWTQCSSCLERACRRLDCAIVTTWQAWRAGLVVGVVGVCVGFLLGGLNLPLWAFLAVALVVAWFGGPLTCSPSVLTV